MRLNEVLIHNNKVSLSQSASATCRFYVTHPQSLIALSVTKLVLIVKGEAVTYLSLVKLTATTEGGARAQAVGCLAWSSGTTFPHD